MPRSFNETEKQTIQRRLLDCGHELFARQGVRKTSLDEIVRCSSIAKGSFYQFYPSKEVLFFAVVGDFQDRARGEIMSRLGQASTDITGMTDAVTEIFRVLMDEPLLRVMLDREEYQAVLLKIPPNLIQDERESDMVFTGDLYRVWEAAGLKPSLPLPVFTDLMRLVALSILNRDIIATPYLEAARILIRGVLIQVFPEAKK